MRTIKNKSIKGVWVPFPDDKDVQILIRPFSLFTMTKMPNEDDVDFTEFWNIFNYCVVDWKGINDEDNKPLKCNEETKKIVYDFDQELVGFIVEQSSNAREGLVSGKAVKNLSKSPDGEDKKSEK